MFNHIPYADGVISKTVKKYEPFKHFDISFLQITDSPFNDPIILLIKTTDARDFIDSIFRTECDHVYIRSCKVAKNIGYVYQLVTHPQTPSLHPTRDKLFKITGWGFKHTSIFT